MNKHILFALAVLATLTFTGCYGTYSTGGQVYGRGPSYGGGYYDAEPVFIRNDYVFISGRQCHVPVYRHRDTVYYTYGGNKHYFNSQERSRYWGNNDRYDWQRKQKNYQYEQRKKELEYQRKVTDYGYEQQKKQYDYQQKVTRYEANQKKAAYKAQNEQAKKQYEYQQKQQEYNNRVAKAQWKAQHPELQKKKKKKDD